MPGALTHIRHGTYPTTPDTTSLQMIRARRRVRACSNRHGYTHVLQHARVDATEASVLAVNG